MSTTIQDEIIHRIYEKLRHDYYKVKSITLGLHVYYELRTEINYTPFVSPATSPYPSFHSWPIKIAYKRKNLIQINLDKPRRKKYAYSCQDNYPMKVIDCLKICKDYNVSFLTSSKSQLDYCND